ncbi:MAG: DUF1330 domain-containing protein [Proteobacteria bacterium]|nr:DUF1330 domain-containing protein [Pseudomonadota bacterium]
MHVVNEVFPGDPKQIEELMKPGPKGPIFMVNLLKFKERAEYEDGRETDLSGREAYMIYGRAVSELLPKFGGRAIFAADVTFLSLGQADELWDEVAIAMYPQRADMVRMSMSEEWRAIAVHRSAGLKGQLNIETVAPNEAMLTMILGGRR